MHQLRQAAARERRAPIVWWLGVMLVSGAALVYATHGHSRNIAMLLTVLLLGAWAAPLVALTSMAAPRRAKKPAPAPGEGRYDDWIRQARLLGRMLLYYGDNPQLPPEIRRSLRAAREDLRDTLRAHPLRDDLERVCERIRNGAIREVKDWFGREYRRDIRELANEYETQATSQMSADARMLALQQAVEKAAAMMSRNCMPRMLERERLACATDCAWLAVQASVVHAERYSPVDVAEMLVIEWSDLSEPWMPARALRCAMERLDREAPVPSVSAEDSEVLAPGEGTVVVRNGKRYRRVRVRHKHRRHRSNQRGPSIADVLLSFGQWIRYSFRSWLLYR